MFRVHTKHLCILLFFLLAGSCCRFFFFFRQVEPHAGLVIRIEIVVDGDFCICLDKSTRLHPEYLLLIKSLIHRIGIVGMVVHRAIAQHHAGALAIVAPLEIVVIQSGFVQVLAVLRRTYYHGTSLDDVAFV